MRIIIRILAALVVITISPQSPAWCQDNGVVLAQNQVGGDARTPARPEDITNANTVTIISGNPNGTYLYFAYDMAAVLDDGDNLRVLPVVGKGGAQNVRDVLFLRGVDMGITQSNILRHFRDIGELGNDIGERLRYIASLGEEEMHLLVRSDIKDFNDLAGKKVNFSDLGSGTQMTCRFLFKDMKVEVQEVNMGQADAFVAIKRGEIAATFLVAAKPAAAFAKLTADPAYKLMAIPYTPELYEGFLPAKLTEADYPALVAPGQQVGTIAVSAVLVVFNWPSGSERYRRVAKFNETFFKQIDKFQHAPRHPKWKEINLAASLPGWKRFTPAQEILDRMKQDADTSMKGAFEDFLALVSSTDPARISKERRDQLFQDFLRWRARQETQK